MSGKHSPRRPCSRHWMSDAAYYCFSCDADRCVRCVYTPLDYHENPIEGAPPRCCRCGNETHVISIHRAEVARYLSRVFDAPFFLFSKEGAALLLGVGALTYLLNKTVVGAPLGLLILCLIFFALLRQTAIGAMDLHLPKVTDLSEDILGPVSRAVAATALLWVPSAIYLYWRAGQLPPDAIESQSLFFLVLADPHVPYMVAAGLVYLPMALMIGAAGGTWTDCINPLRLMGLSVRVAPQYLVGVVATLVLLLAWVGLGRVALFVASTGVPLVSGAIAKALTIYPIFVLARVLGLLFYVRGDVLGYGTDEEYLVPASSDPRPRGQAPVLPSADTGRPGEGAR